MSDDPKNDGQNTPLPSGEGRKRAAPTIDLEASGVTDTTPRSESFDEAPRRNWRSRWGNWRRRSPRDPASSETSPSAAGFSSRVILTSAFSGAVVALLVSGLWSVFSPNDSDPDVPPAQTATIDALSARVSQLELKPTTPGDLGALTKRIDVLDAALAAIRKDVAGVREQVAANAANTDGAKNEAPTSSPAADLSEIENRLGKLEQATVAGVAASETAKPAPPKDDSALRRAMMATVLDQSIRQGVPYTAALAAAVAASGETPALKPLEPFAATGVPTADALSRELLALLPRLDPPTLQFTGDWWDRLRSSASHLVRVTRVDENSSDRAALLVRLKTVAQRGDLMQARQIVDQLPENDRSALQAWINKVSARDAALTASQGFLQAAAALAPALSPPSLKP